MRVLQAHVFYASKIPLLPSAEFQLRDNWRYIPRALDNDQRCGTGRNGTGRRDRSVPTTPRSNARCANSNVPCSHANRLGKVWPLPIDNALRRLLNEGPLSNHGGRGEASAVFVAQSLQRPKLDFNLDKAADLIILVRPARPVQAHLKGDGTSSESVDVRTSQFGLRFQRPATSLMARKARSSSPSGTETATSQLCENPQSGAAGVGHWNDRPKSSSSVLRLAATRSSSSRISAADRCKLSKSPLRLTLMGHPSANP